MSKKINPISFRLGLFQVWDFNLQKYGKNFDIYATLLYKTFQLYDYLDVLTELKDSNINLNEITLKKNKNIINISYLYKKELVFKNIINLKKEISNNSLFLFNSPIFIHLYKESSYVNSANLISNYIVFSLDSKNTLKKVLLNTYKMLSSSFFTKKVSFTKEGLTRFQLQGFKIKISGCFSSSKTQLAKTVQYNFGSLNLTKLCSYIEYSTKNIYTKYGTCGLQIWLIYKPVN